MLRVGISTNLRALLVSGLIAATLVSPSSSHAMIFSSTNHLRQLNGLELQLGSILGQYVRKTEEALDQVKSYLREISETDLKLNGQSEGVTAARRTKGTSLEADDDSAFNPIKAFHVIRRLAIDVKPIYEIFKAHLEIPSVLSLVESQAHLLPLERDLHSAALTLVRLQDTYNLNVSQLARGNVLGVNKNTKFSARDCLYLGKHSFNNGFYGHALSWFDEALKLADEPGKRTSSGSATVDEVMTFRKTALQVHDEALKRKIADEEDPEVNDPPQFRLREVGSDKFDHTKFNRLCRGEKLLSSREESSLRCYYSHRNEAFLLLQPVKVEEHHSNPAILQFHDLISEDEARAVRDLAAPKLIRAMVQGLGEVKRLESSERVSQTAWLHPDHSAVVHRLNRRVQMVSGLSTDVNRDHSEVMQVANYGIGGFYQPHFDYLIVDKPEIEKSQMDPLELSVGDRTATLMFYLSDVIRGGATVFPRLGIGLFPKKLSAVFWYNLKLNGEGDQLTLHGGCPVVYGEKWVGNYWFREIGQTFRRRCSKKRNE